MKNFIKTMLAAAFGTLAGGLFLFFAISTLIGLMIFGSQEAQHRIDEGTVLHLRLNGSLVEKAPSFDFDVLFADRIFGEVRQVGLYDVREALRKAAVDGRIKGVFLKLEKLDAGWAGVTALRRALIEFRSSGKFVYAYADVMDEQTLYLLSAADQLALQPHGFLEFNGLSATPIFFKGLLAKLEVEPRIFRVGKFKSAIEPFVLDRMSEENREQYQGLLNDIWGEAKRGLAETVTVPKERFDALAGGLEIDTAKSAHENGLVPNLMYEHALRDLIKEQVGLAKDEPLNLVSPRAYLRSLQSSPGPSMALSKAPTVNRVAVIFADGEIMMGSSGDGVIGSDSFIETLREVGEDPDVKAVVVRVNSPGGDALAADSIWAEVRALNEKVPVVASMGDIAASGGYYIVAGAREIFAEPTTITGSIGVFGVLVDTEKFFRNKLGVNFDRVVTHPYADLGNSNRQMTDFEERKIQQGVEHVYSRFLDIVGQGRGDKLRRPAGELAEGRVWSGTRALENGLVDQLGGLDSATRRAAELAQLGESYETEVYPRDMDPFSRFAEHMLGSAMHAFSGTEEMAKLAQYYDRLKKLKSGTYMLAPVELVIR